MFRPLRIFRFLRITLYLVLVLTPPHKLLSFTPRSVESFLCTKLNSFQTYSEKDISYVRSSTQILVS